MSEALFRLELPRATVVSDGRPAKMVTGGADGSLSIPLVALMGVGIVGLGLFMIFRARAIWTFQLSIATAFQQRMLQAPGYPHGYRVVGIAVLAFGLVLLLGVARAILPAWDILPGFLDHHQ